MQRGLHAHLLAIGLLVSMASGALAQAQPCEVPPPAVVNIASNKFYSDKQNSVVDPVLWEKRKQAMKPIEDYRNTLARYTGRYLAGNARWADCAADWLENWAKGGAMLGSMEGIQSRYERKWMLAAIAINVLVMRETFAPPRRVTIEAWIGRLADEVAKDTTLYRNGGNNHYYWLGLALGAASQITGNKAHWDFAAKSFRDGMREVTQAGDLPRELARGAKALHYHNFSLWPLVLLAELAKQRGEDWYALEKGAIHRLVGFTLRNMHDQTEIERAAGVRQSTIDGKTGPALEVRNLSWLPFYKRRFPEKRDASAVQPARDIWSWTGGNMDLLAQRWVR